MVAVGSRRLPKIREARELVFNELVNEFQSDGCLLVIIADHQAERYRKMPLDMTHENWLFDPLIFASKQVRQFRVRSDCEWEGRSKRRASVSTL
jgi:hypothetical protein